jgi:uncharacterized protein (TIGR02266 family)
MPAAKSALKARKLLRVALDVLQQSAVRNADVEPAIAAIAAASSALFELDATSISQAGAQARLGFAAERLGESLAVLQGLAHTEDEALRAIEATARALAILYPLATATLRRRRDVVPPRSLPPPDMLWSGTLPRAPEPTRTPRPSRPSYSGQDRRHARDRVPVETDIGLLSDSHFYVGLSQDLSRGGVFVATYEPRPPGTLVLLCFVLPDGHAVEARGVVRWVREATEDTPPGMGVAFERVDNEDLSAVARFCTEREPFYHETGDE